MAQPDRFFYRKNCERENGTTNLIINEPDSPSVEYQTLYQLAIKLPGNHRTITSQFVSRPAMLEGSQGELVKGTSLSPQTKRPLLEARQISNGGGRIIGGGTSKEAIRRAKKKTKNRAL